MGAFIGAQLRSAKGGSGAFAEKSLGEAGALSFVGE
ncbi:hypothetical protein DSW25_10425 [Sulfitobacter donghicola DSW-25 = KCTC 12864 = JCM 14565]|uniref:Uncharacterized protein n=1 Tax=Sulfitobacter donghicola DSW-25 = KCTC 12864 = JCM 14565 TaxID=1300350 RepID=A0A073IH47_9RHOB|nr:hypothetical protein DSW25_10425 [Sulfitobacter donghicola DSW-25 = KCTC 12864 = JCM 14565]